MARAPLSIVQVTPFAWESGHEVNEQIRRTAELLAQRGHGVTIAAPSLDEELVRRSRDRIRDGLAAAEPGSVALVAVGELVAPATGSRRRVALPIDVARTVEELLGGAPFDLCHVHEPFAPSVAGSALRHSRALNVGTFHAPVERLIATQVARKLTDLVFGRLDARLASFGVTAELLRRHFPAEYTVLTPGAEAGERASPGGRTVLVFVDGEEERGALRTFLRGLRTLGLEHDWEARVLSARGPSALTGISATLSERITVLDPAAVSETAVLAAAHVIVLGSDGAAPAPGLILRAIAAGVVPVATSLAAYEEVTGEGEQALLYGARETTVLGAHLSRLLAEPELRERLVAAGASTRARLSFARLTDELEGVYSDLAARRHDLAPRPAVARRLADRPRIDVDLHMHTDHSMDCATPVEVLLATARDQGLGAIAVTDHNVISGAFEAREKAAEYGVKVIVGEEVKTASQGEVIGLFLTELIPRGMTMEATVAEIKRQGGIVYVPHPFDRMHSVPDYEHLLAIIDDVDAIEIYNPRVAIGSFNEEAERFAAKYRIVAGAGSDAHVAPGLGSVRNHMPDFDGPEEFIEGLRMAEIQTKPSSLLYVQALKFLETKATPPAARKARRERRVRRATRKG